MVSPTEWVIKGKASSKYGDYAMGSVNRGTATIIPDSQPPGFAAGGRPDMRIRTPMPSANGQNRWAGSLASAAKAVVPTAGLADRYRSSQLAPGG